MHIAVETLPLGLEALEHALGDAADLLLVVVACRLDAGPAQVRGARFDMPDRQLQLLQPAEGALGRFVRRARRTRLRFRPLLVRALELLDLLPQAPDIATQPVHDEVEEPIEIVLARQLRGCALVDAAMLRHVDEHKGVG